MMKKNKLIEWKLWSWQDEFGRKVESAWATVRRAISHTHIKYAIYWSGGKDSTALTHIVKSLFPKTPIITQFDDCDWPEKESYIDRVAKKRGWEVNKVRPDFSVSEAMKKYDLLQDDICSLTHWMTQNAFIKPLNDFAYSKGWHGKFLGLRIEESRTRKINIYSRGYVYPNNNGDVMALPLASWTAKDVFAYLVSRKIEINPHYLNNRFKEPEDIRLAWAIPSQKEYGDKEQTRYYNRQIYDKWRNIDKRYS